MMDIHIVIYVEKLFLIVKLYGYINIMLINIVKFVFKKMIVIYSLEIIEIFKDIIIKIIMFVQMLYVLQKKMLYLQLNYNYKNIMFVKDKKKKEFQ